jgi:hypothetical protein
MDAKATLEEFLDFLAPKLDVYEQAIYLYPQTRPTSRERRGYDRVQVCALENGPRYRCSRDTDGG